MTYPIRKFPLTRLRRSRMKEFSRKMISEHVLTVDDIIWPVFLIEGTKNLENIDAMPNIHRYSIDVLLGTLENLINLGLNSVALFPYIEHDLKDQDGSLACDPGNLVCRAIKAIKNEYPQLGIICDIALDPFTIHGHDGIITNGDIDNDLTLQKLNTQALVYADAGCDILAPSDMMDGRVGSMRSSLEENGFKDTMIMSYAAKYASSFYGPFRNAIGSGKLVEPKNKKSYQLDFANSNEAMHEIAMDIAEGADMIMVKPGLPYLDIVNKAKSEFKIPTLVYQVSGEYSMLWSAIKNGILSEEDSILESMLCFKRAGADAIFTYFAPYLLEKLNE